VLPPRPQLAPPRAHGAEDWSGTGRPRQNALCTGPFGLGLTVPGTHMRGYGEVERHTPGLEAHEEHLHTQDHMCHCVTVPLSLCARDGDSGWQRSKLACKILRT